MKRLTTFLLIASLLLPMAVSVRAQYTDPTTQVEGNTEFAFALYHQLRKDEPGNLLFSPYSVSQALAMTYAGAVGDTSTQMAETLSFTMPGPALHESLSALNADLTARGTAAADPNNGVAARALHIANGLWGEQTYPFDDEFTALLAEYYGAGLQPTDFVGAPEKARDEINGWVEEQTEDRIQDIVPEGVITELTRLVLANAIYFYGGWAETFDAENTSDADFFLLDGSAVTVPMMTQQESFAYAQGDGFQAIELPYAQSGLAFTVILPDEGQFAAVEESLDWEMLTKITADLAYAEIDLSMPKFEFEFSTGLAEPLQALGMTDAFDELRADFSGMMGDDPPGPLYISNVLHKAFIAVDEDGTEAAAATVVIMTEAMAIEPEEPIVVRIDRPFIFAIRDTRTGTVLFLGSVVVL